MAQMTAEKISVNPFNQCHPRSISRSIPVMLPSHMGRVHHHIGLL